VITIICQSASKPEREGSETILYGVGLQANGNSKRGTSFTKDDDIVRYQWKHWRQFATVVTQMMNSVFGALGNRYFLYYINDVAEAITSGGQVAIKTAEQSINKYLNTLMKTDGNDYVIYCVDGSTKIVVNDKEHEISKFFDEMPSTISVIGDKQIKRLHNRNYFTQTLDVDSNSISHNRINAVIKSRQKKKMYKITFGNKEVITTADHRFLVRKPCGSIEEIAAENLSESDVLVTR
jgi:hypothetical protein